MLDDLCVLSIYFVALCSTRGKYGTALAPSNLNTRTHVNDCAGGWGFSTLSFLKMACSEIPFITDNFASFRTRLLNSFVAWGQWANKLLQCWGVCENHFFTYVIISPPISTSLLVCVSNSSKRIGDGWLKCWNCWNLCWKRRASLPSEYFCTFFKCP